MPHLLLYDFLCFMLKAPKNCIYYIFTFFTFFFIWSIYKNYSLEDFIQRCISTFKFIPVLTIIILGFLSLKNGSLYKKRINLYTVKEYIENFFEIKIGLLLKGIYPENYIKKRFFSNIHKI